MNKTKPNRIDFFHQIVMQEMNCREVIFFSVVATKTATTILIIVVMQ